MTSFAVNCSLDTLYFRRPTRLRPQSRLWGIPCSRRSKPYIKPTVSAFYLIIHSSLSSSSVQPLNTTICSTQPNYLQLSSCSSPSSSSPSPLHSSSSQASAPLLRTLVRPLRSFCWAEYDSDSIWFCNRGRLQWRKPVRRRRLVQVLPRRRLQRTHHLWKCV